MIPMKDQKTMFAVVCFLDCTKHDHSTTFRQASEAYQTAESLAYKWPGVTFTVVKALSDVVSGAVRTPYAQ